MLKHRHTEYNFKAKESLPEFASMRRRTTLSPRLPRFARPETELWEPLRTAEGNFGGWRDDKIHEHSLRSPSGRSTTPALSTGSGGPSHAISGGSRLFSADSYSDTRARGRTPQEGPPGACARPDLRPSARGRHSPSEGTRRRAAAASPASGRRSMKGRRHRPRGRTSQSSAAPARPLSAPQRSTSARRWTRLSQRASWSELRRPRPAFQGRTSAPHDAAPAG